MNENEVRVETEKHIEQVAEILGFVIKELVQRGVDHDTSKLGEDELPTFVEFTPKLRGMTYDPTKGSEYQKSLEAMKPALDHHYANNRHHPEYFENGFVDMDLIDLIEMLCDWLAAVKRHKDGDIIKSIEANQVRFGYTDELKSILLNTVRIVEGVSKDV